MLTKENGTSSPYGEHLLRHVLAPQGGPGVLSKEPDDGVHLTPGWHNKVAQGQVTLCIYLITTHPY